jgi:hypothetical protein
VITEERLKELRSRIDNSGDPFFWDESRELLDEIEAQRKILVSIAKENSDTASDLRKMAQDYLGG